MSERASPEEPQRKRWREQVLHECGFPEASWPEVLAWNANRVVSEEEARAALPLQEDECARWWGKRLELERDEGICPWELLESCYPRLVSPESAQGRGGIHLELHRRAGATLLGVEFEKRVDFVRALSLLTRRKSDEPLPVTQGAALIGGIVNHWRRREGMMARLPGEVVSGTQDKDRLMLVSSSGYAGLEAAEVRRSGAQWRRDSVQIRVAHEMTHFVLRQMRSGLALNLTEEVAADFEGCLAAWPGIEAVQVGEVMSKFLELDGVPGTSGSTRRYFTYLPKSMQSLAPCFGRLLKRVCVGGPSYWLGLSETERWIWWASRSLEELAGTGE